MSLNIAMILSLVDRATGPAGKVAGAVERMSGRARRAGLKSLEISDRMGEFNKRRNAELRGQTVAMAGLAAAAFAALRPAVQFEEAMAKVGAVSRANEGDLMRLTAEARQLGATTPWAASQVAEGMQFLAMAGFDVNQTIAATPGLLDLASAGAIDLGRASDIASNILTGFRIEANQMNYVGDVLTNTFTSSNTTLEMLGGTMKFVAPVATSLGVDLETTAGMAGKLGDAGIQGQMAGTALRAILTRLAAPANAGAKALKKLGVNTQDASGNLRDMPSILADMNHQMEGMGSAARTEVIAAVFGLEAASAATVLLGDAGNGSLQDYIGTLGEVGSAARVAAEINDNTAGSLKRMMSAAEGLSIALGSSLIPLLADMIENIVPVATAATEWAEANPALVKTVGEWAGKLFIASGALLAMKWAFSPVLSAVRAGIWVWGASVIGIGLVGTAVSALATLATAHPILAMVTALAAGALLIYKNWDGIVGYFENVIEKIKTMFAGLVFWEGGVPSARERRHANPRRKLVDPRKRALGGGVRAGFAYEINERGQELFVPSQSGRVIDARTSSRGLSETVAHRSISVGDINIYPPVGVSAEEVGEIVMRELNDLMGNDAALHDGGSF